VSVEVKEESKVMKREDYAVRFPLSEAISFSVESIRRRFTRALITIVSIVLGIAFLSAILTIARIVVALSGPAAGAQALPSYQLWMAIIALLVCAVGIINSMLMSVTERYKEIGTIKTLGAEDLHILEIFLIEGAIMGAIGGVAGGISGWLVAFVIYYFSASGSTAIVMSAALSSLDIVAESIVLSLFLSLLSSLIPAYLAAKLNPVEALRYEV
jgi:putative ABC transport system permease protein